MLRIDLLAKIVDQNNVKLAKLLLITLDLIVMNIKKIKIQSNHFNKKFI